jgi:peptidoglycan-associated lipoprotein
MRGVMRNLLPAFILLALAGCATPKIKPADTWADAPIVDPAWSGNRTCFAGQTVHFDPTSSNLSAEANTRVAQVADYMKTNPATALRIEGHADDLRTEEDNRQLGEARAQAARKELVRLGIPAEKIDTISYGQDKLPLAGRYPRCAEFVLLTPPQ